MNYPYFGRHLIQQRNDGLLREVQELRLGERLRANRRPRSGRSLANTLTWQGLFSLVRGARPSE